MSPKSRGKSRSTRSPAPAPRTAPHSFSDEERAALTPRYTPPTKIAKRFRPPWHRLVGWGQVGLGLLLVIMNYAQDFDVVLLPGGHNELYFLLGIAVAAGGTWWLGAFDRPEKR
ncbi:MAG: hypothetical protein ABIW46_09935 [Acidimicrobiales bacterium]